MTTRRELLVQAASLGGAISGSSSAALGGTTKSVNRTNKSRNFVLVHGAVHGGWCYRRVADLLRAQGHRVQTPTLTGLGERSHLVGFEINCSTHIQDVVNVIHWERLDDVILCGHSYGGFVVGAVADRIPDQIASLVYLDAGVPEDGKSVLDMLSAPSQSALLKAVTANGGWVLPAGAGIAEALGVNAADRPLVDALCTPQPFASFCERLKLRGAYKTVQKKLYIRATNPANPVVGELYARIEDEIAHDASWLIAEVPCGHDVMLDAPNRLAELLLGAV